MKFVYPEHHKIKNGYLSKCQICNSKKMHLILDLGHQPLCDSLLTKEMLNNPEKTYPLRMLWCEECSLAQLDYCVDGNEVYHQDYPYRTGITKELVEYLKDMSYSLTRKYDLNQNDLVVDLGSNDGTLLTGFKKMELRLLELNQLTLQILQIKIILKQFKNFLHLMLLII